MPAHRLDLSDDAAVWPTGRRWTEDTSTVTRWPAIAVATVILLAAFSPSLLPRPWYMQAVACGLGAGIGYLLARTLQRLVRGAAVLTGIRVVAPPRTRQVLGGLALVIAVPAAIYAWVTSHRAHVETATLVSMDPPTLLDDVLATAAGVLAAVLVVLMLIGLQRVWLRLSRLLKRVVRVPKPVARAVSALLVVGLLVWVTNDVLFRGALETVSRLSAEANDETPEGLSAPTSPLRSGSPGAAQPWEELGFNGMKYTGSGPDASRIEQVTGRPATEPIRAYASVAGGEMEDIVATAMSELERMDAFDRSTIHIVTTTGEGWAEEFDVESVEYLTGGDVATVAMQYSYLPSPVALFVDRTTPVSAGTLLLEAVEKRVKSMEKRPKILVSGLSLGSFGGQGAFTDADDLLSRVDGAVWIGTPRFTPLWGDLTSGRRGGSPEIAPVIGDAEHIRFVTRPDELSHDFYGRTLGQWQTPRVAYLQYASDSLMWWSPELAYKEPDWMREEAGHDVSSGLSWWPLITFAQVSVDTVAGAESPAGHGHTYQEDVVPMWAAVLDGLVEDLPEGSIEKIQTAIRENLPKDSQ